MKCPHCGSPIRLEDKYCELLRTPKRSGHSAPEGYEPLSEKI